MLWALGNRLRPEGQRRTVRPDLREAPEGPPGGKEICCGTATGQTVDQDFDLSAPVSQKEAKKRRKATSPEKSISPSTRGQGAFLEMRLNGESASEQA